MYVDLILSLNRIISVFFWFGAPERLLPEVIDDSFNRCCELVIIVVFELRFADMGMVRYCMQARVLS
jgi:hypothetical protein